MSDRSDRMESAKFGLELAARWIQHSPIQGEEYMKAYNRENLMRMAKILADWVENYADNPQEGKR